MVKHAKAHGKAKKWLRTHNAVEDRELRTFGLRASLEKGDTKVAKSLGEREQ